MAAPDQLANAADRNQTVRDSGESREAESFNVNLRRKYPISPFVVIKRAGGWICLWLILLILVGYTQSVDSSSMISAQAESEIDRLVLFLFLCSSVVAGVFVLYQVMFRASYYYAIKEGHLVIAKGVILRQRGSFPLSRITDVYLTRTVADFVFGLYDLHISTPTTSSGMFAKIDGLGRAAAVAFQRDLTGYIEAYSEVRQSHLEEVSRRQSQMSDRRINDDRSA